MYDVINMPDLVSRYFSSNLWLSIFLASAIYLFIRVNTAHKRAILVVIAVFFMVINKFVIKIFTDLGENSTFYRQLWAIPSIAIIGIAIIDLVRILPKLYLKITAIVALATLLFYINQTEYIRCRDHYLSKNAAMVQEEVISLEEGFSELQKRSDKNTFFVVCPTGFGFNYGDFDNELKLYAGFLSITDSSILSNADHDGEAELTGDSPNVSYIMSTCCAKGIDYVIVSKNEKAESKYTEHGYSPVFATDSYLVFHCSGYCGHVRDLDKWGMTKRRSYYDENGEPDLQAAGYSTITYVHDGKGNKTEEHYYGPDGKPCINTSGCAGVIFKYNNQNKCIKETYIGGNGEVCTLAAGYASIVRTYTINGLLESEKYVDIYDNPILINGCFELRREYDENKRLAKESYYDENGQLMLRTDELFASRTIEYDKKGRTIGERYYNTEGQLTIKSSGYAAYERELTEDGWVIRESYLDANMQSVMLTSSFSALSREYDDNGLMLVEAYLNTEGIITNRNTAYAKRLREYNDNKRMIKETYVDANGQPVVISEGYAGYTRDYDARGNIVTETYIDTEGNPVACVQGYARICREFDDQNRVIWEGYKSIYGTAIELADGYASLRKEYDNRGNNIRESYYDSGSKLVCLTSGFAIIEREYNDKNQLTKESYLDENEEPITLTTGYSSKIYEYDSFGNICRVAYLDAEAKPAKNRGVL